jgi:peroxiredoxin
VHSSSYYPGMRRIGRYAVGLFVLTTIALGREYGPPIGATMPDFELRDQDGKIRSLKSLLGSKGGVILFQRSADWCAYCKSQLVDVEKSQAALRTLGLSAVAISYDSVAVLHTFAQRRGVTFPLLSDPDSNIIRQLGILNESIPENNPFFGSAYPCLFILDTNEVILAKYFEDDHRQRYDLTTILTHQFGVSSAIRGTEVENNQVKVEAMASHSIVAVGQRVALTLDVELKPNMHVYGHDVEGYIPIEWKMKESDATATHEVRYPAAEKIHFATLDETVPVYRGHFRLRGLITIAEDGKLRPLLDTSGNFSVESTFRYQACDDRTCYPPREVPIQFTFQYLAFDR